jgi:uncharacterized cupredoxin-like copper-binding protein
VRGKLHPDVSIPVERIALMHRSRATLLVSLSGLCLLAGLLSAVFLAGPASGRSGTSAVSKTTIVVTAGKPSEFSFQLSSRKALAGIVVFKVTNKGKVPHTFEICTTASTTVTNTCKGTVTKSLAPGKSQVLTVNMKKGNHEYLCTVPGHAQLGMKGILGVGVTPPAPPPVSSTTARTTTTVTTQSTCASPTPSTVNVTEFDYGFTLSPTSAHCGPITFVQTNTGNTEHNFNINGMAAAIIQAGQSTTNTFTFGPGTFDYQCDVPGHVGLGMFGKFTVTG